MNINYYKNDHFVTETIDSNINFIDLCNNDIDAEHFNDTYFANNSFMKIKDFVNVKQDRINLTNINTYTYTCKGTYNYINVKFMLFVNNDDYYSATPLNYETMNIISINGNEYKFYNNLNVNMIINKPSDNIITITKLTSNNLCGYGYFTEFNL